MSDCQGFCQGFETEANVHNGFQRTILVFLVLKANCATVTENYQTFSVCHRGIYVKAVSHWTILPMTKNKYSFVTFFKAKLKTKLKVTHLCCRRLCILLFYCFIVFWGFFLNQTPFFAQHTPF